MYTKVTLACARVLAYIICVCTCMYMCVYLSACARRKKNERTGSDIEFSSTAVIKIVKNLGHGFVPGFVPRLSDAIFSGYCTCFLII